MTDEEIANAFFALGMLITSFSVALGEREESEETDKLRKAMNNIGKLMTMGHKMALKERND